MFIPLPNTNETEEFFKKMFLEFQNLRKEQNIPSAFQEPNTQELERLSQMYLFAEFGKLTSGLFHDLVSPLTAISLQIEELKIQHNHPKKIQNLVDQAFHATKHLETFLKNIRKQIQNQEEKEKFSLSNEIQQALLIVAHQAEKLRVRITTHLPAVSLFFGNPIKFHQMIVNLLTNAIDAYEEIIGEKHVEIHLEQVGDQWELRVIDYGVGIPEEQKQYIFEPLFTTKKSSKGVGIGLCIVKYKIEKEFGGTIELCDTIPRGTTFTLRFPHTVAPIKTEPINILPSA